jgi:membrane-associated phospholipid phosphatase
MIARMLPIHYLRVIVCTASFLAMCASVSAQTPDAASAPGPIGILKEAAKDLTQLVSLETLRILAIGAGGAAAVHPADRHVNPQLNGADYRFLTPGRILGNAAVQGGGAAVTYLWGRARGPQSRVATVGQQLVRAQLVTQATTLAIKITVRRDRPDGNGHLSFPSGHASTTFATATILDGHFGWKVAIPTYLVATYVATSRLHENRHNASDVVFGAALGVAAGRITLRREKSRVQIQPVALSGGAGMVLLW